MSQIVFNKNVVPVGQLFFGAGVSGGVMPVIPPSANLHGLIIRTLTVVVAGGGVNVFADTSAPSGATDFTKRIIFEYANTNNDSATLPYELYLYPGLGLWTGSSASAADIFLTYDLLTPD
jgi:hypothetical protein